MNVIGYFKKWLLGAFVAAIPVVIAACYGPMYDVQGRVNDSKTDEGITGIEVTCINYDDLTTPSIDEGEELVTYTRAGGYYEFEKTSTGSCAVVKLRDVDDTENGVYLRKTVYVRGPFPSPIEMYRLK